MEKKKFPFQKTSQPVSKASPPITPVGNSYRPPEKPPPIPKPTDPGKTPRKTVQRELDHNYGSLHVFLTAVEQYTRREFIETRPDQDVPHFPEFSVANGIEVLRDIFSRLPTEFQARNEIHWFLASRWEGKFSELHTFLIAAGVWKFILLHSEEVKEGNSGATHHQEAETGEAVAQRAAGSEEQGAENAATIKAIIDRTEVRLTKQWKEKDKVTHAQAAAILSLKQTRSIREKVKQGKLRSGGTGYISVPSLLEYLDQKFPQRN